MLARWPNWLRRMLFTLTGVNWANRYARRCQHPSQAQMLADMFAGRGMTVTIENEALIDHLGPCIVAGNHPHGLWDGLALAMLASQQGHRSKVIARDFLTVFTPLADQFLTVKLSTQRKLVGGQSPLAPALAHLAAGGRVVMTPAGGLSIARPMWSEAKDPPWRSGVARLMVQSQCPVVLVRVFTAKSVARQLAHRLHPIIRALAQLLAFRLRRSADLRLSVLRVVHPEELPYHDPQRNALWLQSLLD